MSADRDPTDRPDFEPLIIGGSHLQALIYAVCGATVAIVWRDEVVGWPLFVSVALFAAAGTVAYRRCELHDTRLTARRIGQSVDAPVGTFSAELGHRYLTAHTQDGHRIRIEVPVEIRPNVRDWVTERTTALS